MMDARTYLNTYGDERCLKVAKASGTTLGYFKQIAYGHRRPSPDLAHEFVRHSNGELDFMELLRPTKKAKKRR